MADGKCTTCVLDRLQKFVDGEKRGTNKGGAVQEALTGVSQIAMPSGESSSSLRISDTAQNKTTEKIADEGKLVSISREMVKWLAANGREAQSTNKLLLGSITSILNSIDGVAAAINQSKLTGRPADAVANATPTKKNTILESYSGQIPEMITPERAEVNLPEPLRQQQQQDDVPVLSIEKLIEAENEQTTVLTVIDSDIKKMQTGVDRLFSGIESLGKKFDNMNDAMTARENAREAARKESIAPASTEEVEPKESGKGILGILGSLLGGIGSMASGLLSPLKNLGGLVTSLAGSIGSLLAPLGTFVSNFVTLGGLATAGTLAGIGAGIGIIAWELYEAHKRIKETRELLEGVKQDEATQQAQRDTAKVELEAKIENDRLQGKDTKVDERVLAQVESMNYARKIKDKQDELNKELVIQKASLTVSGPGGVAMPLPGQDKKIERLQKELADLEAQKEKLRSKATDLVPGNTYYTGNLEYVGKAPKLETSTRDEMPYENAKKDSPVQNYTFGEKLSANRQNRQPFFVQAEKNQESWRAVQQKPMQQIVLPPQNNNVIDQSTINNQVSTNAFRPNTEDIRRYP